MKTSFCFAIFLFFGLAIPLVWASSHGEAPNAQKRPMIDPTDVYAFRSYEPGRSNWITILVNYYPLQDANAGPNYHSLSENHYYEIYIDQDGDGKEDQTYQFTFKNELPNKGKGIELDIGGKKVPIALKTAGPITAADQSALNWIETYQIKYIEGDREGDGRNIKYATDDGETEYIFTKPFDYSGTKTFPNYEAYVAPYIYDIDVRSCKPDGKVFVGQRLEGFSINIGPIFDLVNLIPLAGAVPNVVTNNQLRRKGITTIALELPISCVTGNGNGVIGVWTAARGIKSGTQKTRLGNPLVNELLVGLRDKGKYNKGRPSKDDDKITQYIYYPTFPQILQILFGAALGQVAPTNFPRKDLEAVFLKGIKGVNQMKKTDVVEIMRLNTQIPVTPRGSQNPIGLAAGDPAGYPNGRRPGDDVIDISLRALVGVLCYVPPVTGDLCVPADAPSGLAPIIDGAPLSDLDFDNAFPYLRTPLAGNLPV